MSKVLIDTNSLSKDLELRVSPYATPIDLDKILELQDEIKHRITWLTIQTTDANEWAKDKLERDEVEYHNKIITIKQILGVKDEQKTEN